MLIVAITVVFTFLLHDNVLAAAAFGPGSDCSTGTAQVYGAGDKHPPADLEALGAKLLKELSAADGVWHANVTIWTTKTSSYHLFATNKTEGCHFHPGTTFATTRQGEGAFRIPDATAIEQTAGDSFYIPEGKVHAFGPADGSNTPVLVTVLWTPPYHPKYTIPAEGCRM